MNQTSLFEDQPELLKSRGALLFSNWLLVDGNNLMNRCFYATQSSLKPDDLNPLNAVVGFIRTCINYQDEYEATVVVFFDKGKGFRKKKFPEYKEGRGETPAQLKSQFSRVFQFLDAAGIPYYWSEQLEADDLISAAARQFEGHKYVLSNDQDLLQIISDTTTVIARKGKDDVLMTPERFSAEFDGLIPTQITDLKALSGDTSDNIPGVKGIGDKGALAIVKHFGKIENLKLPFPAHLSKYQKYFDLKGLADAIFFKQLTTLVSTSQLQINRYEMNYQQIKVLAEQNNLFALMKFLNKKTGV
jgi:DNA polymerase I